MTNAVASRLGQINGAGASDALFLKVFSGEVLTAFTEKNVMADKVQTRSISSGKSAQFPLTGKIGANYHTVGSEILGLNLPASERIITIDDLLISHAFISNLDEAKNHYDVRSIYSGEIGKALANTWDKHAIQLLVKAARDVGGVVTGEAGGGNYIDAAVATSAAKLMEAAYAAAQRFDEQDVPEDERYLLVRPAQYNILTRIPEIISRDFNTNNGDTAANLVMHIAGMKVVKSNHIPSTVVATGTLLAGTGDKYAGDFSTTVAIAFQKQAIGCVKLLDVASEMDYDIRRQGTLMVSKYANGMGILRPACAFEIKTA